MLVFVTLYSLEVLRDLVHVIYRSLRNRSVDAVHVWSVHSVRITPSSVDASWNVMPHAQKQDLVFRQNEQVHLNRRGRQFTRLLAAEMCTSAVVMLDTPCSEVVWRVLATHSIRQFPLHFPSRASPCAITFQLESTTWPFLGFRWRWFHVTNLIHCQSCCVSFLVTCIFHCFIMLSVKMLLMFCYLTSFGFSIGTCVSKSGRRWDEIVWVCWDSPWFIVCFCSSGAFRRNTKRDY